MEEKLLKLHRNSRNSCSDEDTEYLGGKEPEEAIDYLKNAVKEAGNSYMTIERRIITESYDFSSFIVRLWNKEPSLCGVNHADLYWNSRDGINCSFQLSNLSLPYRNIIDLESNIDKSIGDKSRLIKITKDENYHKIVKTYKFSSSDFQDKNCREANEEWVIK